eukprot:1632303-Rhodomonas_salina.1
MGWGRPASARTPPSPSPFSSPSRAICLISYGPWYPRPELSTSSTVLVPDVRGRKALVQTGLHVQTYHRTYKSTRTEVRVERKRGEGTYKAAAGAEKDLARTAWAHTGLQGPVVQKHVYKGASGTEARVLSGVGTYEAAAGAENDLAGAQLALHFDL